ncbi:D-lactate dehydrogenase [Sporothrix brasiliensis 5110]|uniref:D-lactate dehydrogenase n=1 Tax=Sporothrix brasiliensis 5110 TaxID=1398154 RepID=A0A0C2J0K5_9PEZI|nr:D-lactate dehydrogenase [Sporothrix brasiliensis 5110]KIH94916.1 D-lactate dehydrogenase [Sporothrix brasiliensis 5110]
MSVKVAVFSAKPYDKEYLSATLADKKQDVASSHSQNPIELVFHDSALGLHTVALARGATAVCVFVNDVLDAAVLEALSAEGVRAVLLRCAGYNNVDLAAAETLGVFVANVPSYSPEAVAEFSVALLQTLNRRTHRAYNRVREGNFALDGLLGMTLHGKTVGVVGTGRIGLAAARIFKGYGCRVLAHDPYPSAAFVQEELGEYRALDDLLPQCDVVSLYCPLTKDTHHLIDERTLPRLKPGALLINTSRGGLIATKAVIAALKSRHLGGVALDVYEGEGGLFYNDHSGDIIDDDELMRLMTFPNVLVCGHQAFFTVEALTEIANVTLQNLGDFLLSRPCPNALVAAHKQVARRDSLPVRI